MTKYEPKSKAEAEIYRRLKEYDVVMSQLDRIGSTGIEVIQKILKEKDKNNEYLAALSHLWFVMKKREDDFVEMLSKDM